MGADMQRGWQGVPAKKLTDSQGTTIGRWGFARKIALAGLSSRVFARPNFWPFGQFSTGQSRIVGVSCALALGVLVAAGCGPGNNRASNGGSNSTTTPVRGGQAVASARVEPRSFNRLASRDSSTEV